MFSVGGSRQGSAAPPGSRACLHAQRGVSSRRPQGGSKAPPWASELVRVGTVQRTGRGARLAAADSRGCPPGPGQEPTSLASVPPPLALWGEACSV